MHFSEFATKKANNLLAFCFVPGTLPGTLLGTLLGTLPGTLLGTLLGTLFQQSDLLFDIVHFRFCFRVARKFCVQSYTKILTYASFFREKELMNER